MIKFFLCLLFPITLFAQADVKGGGGGLGVVCYNSQEEIQSVELLDFYEGKNLEGYNIPERTGDYKSIYQEVTSRKAPWEPNYLGYGLELAKKFKFLASGVRLKPTLDAGEILIPKGCKVEQIVNYQGTSRVFVVSDFWNHMSETNRAGLVLHERLWSSAKEAGDSTSARTRRTVARFFSEDFFFEEPEFIKLLNEPGLKFCWAKNPRHLTDSEVPSTGFYVTPISGSTDCKLSFRWLNGLPVQTNQTALLNDCNKFVGNEDPIASRSQIVHVMSHPDDVQTHEMIFTRDIKVENNTASTIREIRVSNLEFPGYNETNLKLECAVQLN